MIVVSSGSLRRTLQRGRIRDDATALLVVVLAGNLLRAQAPLYLQPAAPPPNSPAPSYHPAEFQILSPIALCRIRCWARRLPIDISGRDSRFDQVFWSVIDGPLEGFLTLTCAPPRPSPW